ncbi:2OG-Fe(II) oxygenase [Kitasatospora sp. YST-16]|uniref:2OG-Fe(II) oxygenase n=1 Tax=Kitasatospora sp. YST-16 TaxID=2998080 RepID=UPI002283B621|nr:2OG-Fe(II) oxygenase [Kitasatospora sp. YST-16]WAL72913.1 2OG-Fe(II) oxygenase [Kitasatospora sp. YST-16]
MTGRATLRGRRFAVLDDFLDGAALEEARRTMAASAFSAAESPLLTGQDGALRSRGTVVRGAAAGRGAAGDPAAYGLVRSAVAAEPELFGRPGEDWDRVGFTFWNYPVGSGLAWHGDAGGGRRGSYVLFLNEEWRASWGGELMVLDEEEVDTGTAELQVRESASSPVAIVPRPNRLVLLRAGTPHRINRVDPTAALVRCSLTGFAMKRPDEAGADARARFRELVGALKGASE